MKAVDVATKNHVSIEDIINICNEMGISCDGENNEISEQDIFLVEKRIESIKEKKAEETLKLIEKKNEKAKRNKGKKIKLKRKVQVSDSIRKSIKDETQKKSVKPKKEEEDKSRIKKEKPREEGDTKKPRDRKEEVKGKIVHARDKKEKEHKIPGKKTPRDFASSAPGRKKVKAAPAQEDKESVAFPSKESHKKRKKEKEKEKDRDFKKKFQEEKNLVIRKKKPVQREYVVKETVTPQRIEITENISVGDLSKKLNVKAKEVIAKLMKLGLLATINQIIDAETAEILCSEYGTEVKVVSLFEETIIRDIEEDKTSDRTVRPPIVTVMGHVDHGKTRLLDSIRETNVIDMEYGGITQHIGAYMVKVNDQNITFLDTPGHEAFTTMRARGASITDIVILVVAANDGVMPQTVEAINHAKDAGVPIIVAINKIDLPEANVQKVRQELSNYGLLPEEWGGSTLFAEISAKQKTNIDELLELVLIQAEMLELKANPKIRAVGTVIESRIDPGRGPVATILIQNGTLNISDPYVVGIYSGRVRAIFNDLGQAISEAGPSTPVEVLGLSGVPSAGDPFQVVESEKYAKLIAEKRQELRRVESAKKVKKVTLEELNAMIKDGEVQELRIIIKGDVDGSVQALKEALEKISTEEIRIKVVHAGTGGINESDVMLASASNAIIIGYHVRPAAKVSEIADRENVSIKFYNIIYDATNDIKAAMEGMLSPDFVEESMGSGEIRQVFKISKLGTIAGAVVLTGKLGRTSKIRLVRDGIVVYDGVLNSLKRFKDDASEVLAGMECGFGLKDFNDIKEGDTFEAYRVKEIAKKLEG